MAAVLSGGGVDGFARATSAGTSTHRVTRPWTRDGETGTESIARRSLSLKPHTPPERPLSATW